MCLGEWKAQSDKNYNKTWIGEMALTHMVEEQMSGLLLPIPDLDLSNADVASQLGEVPAEMVRWVREQRSLGR